MINIFYLKFLRRLMNLHSFVFLLIFGIAFLFISCCGSPEQQRGNDECIDSFDSFAYSPPERNDDEWQAIYPLYPWHQVSDILESELSDGYQKISVATTRTVKNHTEIWIEREISPTPSAPVPYTYEFLIFSPDSGQWKTVSAEIGDTGIWVDQLFITDDGTLWGHNTWKSSREYSIDYIPVLSRYNENLEEFEFEQNSIRYKLSKGDMLSAIGQIVLLGNNNLFWM